MRRDKVASIIFSSPMVQTQNEKGKVSLPAILCLHGYGANASIFQYQLRHITLPLTGIFRFIFIDAPFYVQQPGPGIPLGFLDAGSFRRWHSDENLAGAFGVSAGTLRDEKLQVRELLRKTLESEKAQGFSVVGVFAFSQGAAVGAALCLDPELNVNVKFTVMFCALYPALSLKEDDDKDAGAPLVITVPSIHVQGSSDAWKGQGDKMFVQYFDVARARKIELRGLKHEVPGGMKEVAMVVDAILGVWRSE